MNWTTGNTFNFLVSLFLNPFAPRKQKPDWALEKDGKKAGSNETSAVSTNDNDAAAASDPAAAAATADADAVAANASATATADDANAAADVPVVEQVLNNQKLLFQCPAFFSDIEAAILTQFHY